ncbi:hypothetical protein NKH77_40185 [Streptomyces sp. M19]
MRDGAHGARGAAGRLGRRARPGPARGARCCCTGRPGRATPTRTCWPLRRESGRRSCCGCAARCSATGCGCWWSARRAARPWSSTSTRASWRAGGRGGATVRSAAGRGRRLDGRVPAAVGRRPGGGRRGGAGRGSRPGLLLARCTVSAVRDGSRVEPDALPALLPEPLRERLAEAAERADPAADLTLNIACPECGAATRAELDVAAYLWTELDAWARDLLLDVHLLATAYGWSEPEVLALSPLRRRYYLELCADA